MYVVTVTINLPVKYIQYYYELNEILQSQGNGVILNESSLAL